MKKLFMSLILLFSPALVLAQTTCSLNGEDVPCGAAGGAAAAGAAIGIGMIIIAILVGLVSLLGFIFWVWMLIHAIAKPVDNKAVWIIAMIILGLPVSIIYYFVVKRKFVETPAPIQPVPPAPEPPKTA